jgi:uncharacterized DUF497 family protein
MLFEWNQEKALIIVIKHGVGFDFILNVFIVIKRKSQKKPQLLPWSVSRGFELDEF